MTESKNPLHSYSGPVFASAQAALVSRGHHWQVKLEGRAVQKGGERSAESCRKVQKDEVQKVGGVVSVSRKKLGRHLLMISIPTNYDNVFN